MKISITNLVDENFDNFTILIMIPNALIIDLVNFQPGDLNITGNSLFLNRSLFAQLSVLEIFFKIKTPNSIPFTIGERINFNVNYERSSIARNFVNSHLFFINPIPTWIIYFTIILGISLLISIIIIARKTKMLEKFTTLDLANITVLSSLGAIVFKWIWQMFNDFLGIFGGLLMTIPASLLMIIAIYLVKKPGTATLFFMVWEFVNFFVWGSNIMSWFGWYLLEGIIVDLSIIILRDYAEKWYTAALYGTLRCFISYWTSYFWFSPAIWKVYYAPWYAWLQVIIGAIGGIIGGILGFYLAKRLEEAIVV